MAVIFLSLIILWAVPLHSVDGSGCEQVNPSPSEKSPAFPDMIEDAGPIEQSYSIKTEDAEPIEQNYSIKTEDARSMEHRCYIVTEDSRSIEQKYSIKTEDDASIDIKYHLIDAKEEASSVEQEHHSVQMEDAASMEDDVTMEVKLVETNFKMPEQVCILLIAEISVY